MVKKVVKFSFLSVALLLLSACSSFTGIRTPKYDGRPFEVQPEKIAAYEESREIIGEEKEYYLPESFSADVLNSSLDVVEHDPLLLEEGTYLIGEDVPAGRVTLLGVKEDPNSVIVGFESAEAPPSPEDYNVGTMTIRDAEDRFYFENMFHPYYGVQIAQVDFIEGHTIEIVGSNPEIVVFYADLLPEDPYIFDTRWEDYLAELEEQGFEEFVEVEEFEEEAPEAADIPAVEQDQPLNVSEDGQVVELKAGIYEVGKHFEPGTYEITEEASPTHTEIFLFSGSEEPRVFEVSTNLYGMMHGWVEIHGNAPESEKPVIELKAGDKIYPHYINHLKLTKLD